MADIDLVIGAKNEASAVLKQFSAEVQKSAQEVELSFKGMLQMTGIGLAVEALIGAQTAIIDFARDSIAAFDEVNRSSNNLSDTLALLGQSGEGDALKAAADNLERISNINEAGILDQMSKALRGGSAASQVDDMAAAAVGLAKVYDTDLATAMQKVKAATEGNFESFAGLIPNIDKLATVDQKLAAVSQLAAQGLQQKSDMAKTAAESGARMEMAWRNVSEAVGSVLAPIRDVAMSGLAYIADVINVTVLPAIQSLQGYADGMANGLRDALQYAAESAIVGFSAIQTVAENMGAAFDIAVNSVALSLEGMRADFEHVLTVAIPQYGVWFSDNFLNILRDVAVAASHIVENIVVNINNIMTGQPLVGLLDGFQATMDELPQIAERGITEVEKVLQKNIESKMQPLMEQFETNRVANLEAFGKRMAEDFQSAMPEIKLDIKAGFGQEAANFGGKGSGSEILQAFESRVLTRGPSSTPIDKLIELQQKAIEQQKENAKLLSDIRDNGRGQEELRIVAVD